MAVIGLLLLGILVGCSAAPGQKTDRRQVLPAREGQLAASTRVTFTPEKVTLPGGDGAEVLPARTVGGELKVPEHVRHVGWWDGSASAGDPFGSTVIAGHVDSAMEGLGYFVRLLKIEKGDRVTVSGDGHRQAYRVVSITSVAKKALATTNSAFDQRGEHRLVLITCTGAFVPGRGYDSNLVVVGKPIGPAR